MPTYEYVCMCGEVFEDFQPMPGARRKKCPVCGKDAMKKIGPGAGIIFRGSGFYATDYRGQP